MKKQISAKTAREKYGVIVKKPNFYKFYLLDDGRVIDSDGDIRALPQDQPETWTITAQFTVFAGDMSPEEVTARAEQDLANLIDGTDYIGASVIEAKRDEN